MKKESNQVNPYDEMDFPEQELNETLKLDSKKQIKEEPKQEKDYLDDFTPETNGSQKQFSQPLMFNDDGKDNLVLNLLKVDWERIEHIIRGHKPKIDEDGNEYFVKIENHYLNDYGVNSMLHFLSFYLSKDIKLGRYKEEQVQKIMNQFSKQFTDFFFDNIEEFGLDTPEKKKMSKMFVQAVIDLVDASYSCAIGGKTIELLLKQFQVLQQQRFDEDGFSSVGGIQNKKPSMMQRIFG